MPAGPFLGASMGKMFDKTTEGVVQGQLQRMLLDREDRQDALRERRLNEEMEYRRDALGINAESKKQAQMKGFIDGAMNFYKTTGNAEATKNFWNQNAPQYGLARIDSFRPIDTNNMQVHFEGGRGILVNKNDGTVTPLTTSSGQEYAAPQTYKQQADEMAGRTRLDVMTGAEVDPNVAAAAGVRLPTERAAKTMTPMQAMKRKTDLLTSRVKLLKGNEIDALLATLNPNYQPGSSVDDKTKQAVDAQIEAEIAQLDQIISGGSGQQQAGAGQGGSSLAGKPPGRYRVNGQVVKWDGQKVIK